MIVYTSMVSEKKSENGHAGYEARLCFFKAYTVFGLQIQLHFQ